MRVIIRGVLSGKSWVHHVFECLLMLCGNEAANSIDKRICDWTIGLESFYLDHFKCKKWLLVGSIMGECDPG